MHETLTGDGTVTNAAGEATPVTYKLSVRKNERPGRLPDMHQGRVSPVCGTVGEQLTLATEHGLTVKFSFEDRSGSIIPFTVQHQTIAMPEGRV
jgi:hypothetical protein